MIHELIENFVIQDPTPGQLGHRIAHEIGHVMLKEGHPDEFRISSPVTSGGPAPLQSLNKISDWEKRLMCSGTYSGQGSNLLVKKEWDVAEEWLARFPDNRIREERDLENDEPTGNY